MRVGSGILKSAVLAALVFTVACKSSSPAMSTTPKCQFNTECVTKFGAGYQCAPNGSGYCVPACLGNPDCPAGQRCITLTALGAAGGVSGTDGLGGAGGGLVATAPTGSVCQPPELQTCTLNSQCIDPLVCGIDRQCRNQCNTAKDCGPGRMRPQVCTSITHVCVDLDIDGKTYDPTTNEIIMASGTGGTVGAGGMVGAGGQGAGGSTGKGGMTGNGCLNPQTAFGNVAQGDANPSFVSGVGVRASDRLVAFTGYTGAPLALGGMGGTPMSASAGGMGGTANVNLIFVQTFDAATGVALEPATPLFKAGDGTNLYLHNAAISPTGEIALLYGTGPLNQNNNTLWVAFLSTTAAAGNAGVQLERTPTQIESAQFGSVGSYWSAANQQFVFYWEYYVGGWQIRTKKFQGGGTPAGGDTNAVPTASGLNGTSYSPGVGASGQLFAVGYRDYSTGHPTLTLLDVDGTQVGTPIKLEAMGIGQWIQVGGTANGFSVLYQRGSNAYQVFLPKTADGLNVQLPSGAGGAGGAGGATGTNPWTTFNIPSSATEPNVAFTIGDEAGAGGVGTVYLESNGASFLYVTADGSKRFAIGSVISSSTGSQVAITNHHGSFGVSLFDKTKHSVQLVASGCTK
ncbi:MAG TPA: hypothetical protein VHU40_02770 [Polyangia bacterium]|nr:hypothetical protein [Polyangia bacterium]